MVLAINQDDLLRGACESALAAHIRARLVQTGRVLAKGSPEGQAKYFVKRWKPESVRIFYFLVHQAAGRCLSKSELARGADCSGRAVDSFWGRTLKSMRVAALHSGTKERADIQLFRRGHEMFWSNSGIKLQVRGELLAFATAREITDTTRPALVAATENYEGATCAQEADASMPAVERTQPRERLKNDLEHREPEKKQGNLFKRSG